MGKKSLAFFILIVVFAISLFSPPKAWASSSCTINPNYVDSGYSGTVTIKHDEIHLGIKYGVTIRKESDAITKIFESPEENLLSIIFTTPPYENIEIEVREAKLSRKLICSGRLIVGQTSLNCLGPAIRSTCNDNYNCEDIVAATVDENAINDSFCLDYPDSCHEVYIKFLPQGTRYSTFCFGQKTITETEDNITCDSENGVQTALGCIPTDPRELIKWVFPYLLGLGGLSAFALIVFSGIQILTSGGNPEKIQGAKETITSAVTGLLFIILSLFLLKLIGGDILGLPAFLGN
jgi:hypothetical protein